MTIRQLKMLMIMKKKPDGYTESEALKFNQRTFGSLCHNYYVEYDAYSGKFIVGESGLEAFKYFNGDLFLIRQNNNGKFSSFVQIKKRNRGAGR